jgi:drug/metabolite transporter (DMT)-like permease
VWAVLSKLLGSALSAEQSQALSTLGFLPIVAALALSCRGALNGASCKGLVLAFAGGVVSCLGNIPYYAAVSRGEKFATMVSLAALAPLVTVLLAMVFLKERLTHMQWAGLASALAAIWLFNVPDDRGLLSPAVMVALAPITLWGLSGFLQKAATNQVSGEASALMYLGAFLPMGAFYAVREPWPGDLSAQGWMLVIALGFFLAFGNYAVLSAYARGGKASVAAPLVNLFPVVSIGIAVLFLGESIGGREWVGVAFALASVVALSMEAPVEQPAEGKSGARGC